ncbi:MAG TPA: hypothetical protein H9793_09930 [Candidatus Brevibacterium intestinigallinarum]|nr:hypothetical protein [Candidatus Brevibacterium intestinigallinarum]
MMMELIAQATTEPTPTVYPDAESVTPGTIGFVFTFLLAAAVVLLGRSLIRRQRRLRLRAGVVRHHPIPVERGPRTGPQNRGMSTGVDLETGESVPPPAADGQDQQKTQPEHSE